MKRWMLALVLASGLLAGCADVPETGVGRPAPEFQAVTLAGDTVSLRELRGAPVLVNLWATWCAPCRRETPFLQSVHERYAPRGLRVLGVTTDSRASVPQIEEFLEEFGVTYTILHDPDARSMDVFAAIGLPASYLIGSDGTLLWSRLGEVREGDAAFEEALEGALADAEAEAESGL